MHIHDRAVGFYGETAIVGGGLGWASGAAWARKRRGLDSIAVAYAGDGAFANGVFAEAVRVADFWDALTHDRPYRAAWTPDTVRAEVERGVATHFDPEVAHAFLGLGM